MVVRPGSGSANRGASGNGRGANSLAPRLSCASSRFGGLRGAPAGNPGLRREAEQSGTPVRNEPRHTGYETMNRAMTGQTRRTSCPDRHGICRADFTPRATFFFDANDRGFNAAPAAFATARILNRRAFSPFARPSLSQTPSLSQPIEMPPLPVRRHVTWRAAARDRSGGVTARCAMLQRDSNGKQNAHRRGPPGRDPGGGAAR